MVIDLVDGQHRPRYLVYDVVMYRGQSYMHRPFFPDRLNCIKENVVGKLLAQEESSTQYLINYKLNVFRIFIADPRNKAHQKGLLNKGREPFGLRNKDFWELRHARTLLGPAFRKQLPHEPDGLIFQPSLEVRWLNFFIHL